MALYIAQSFGCCDHFIDIKSVSSFLQGAVSPKASGNFCTRNILLLWVQCILIARIPNLALAKVSVITEMLLGGYRRSIFFHVVSNATNRSAKPA